MRNKKLMYITGGAGAGIIVLAIVLCLALGSCGGSKYDKYYNQAQTAYLAQDYSGALENLEKAISAEAKPEAYLLMAEVYRRQGNIEMAIQVLYLGYTKTGDDGISRRLEELKAEKNGSGDSTRPEEFQIAGSTVPLDSTSLVLVEMNLTDGDISDIGRLASLESLSLSDNKLSSISALSSLSQLTSLQISNNDISDLTPVKSLTRLKTLYISGNPITDFTPLYGMTSLKTLIMTDIDVTEEQLFQLREALPGCSIRADIEIVEIEELKLGDKTFMSNVTELDLHGQTLTDLSALSKCTELERLDLHNCRITDISNLVDLQSLTWLDISENEVEDLRPLMTLEDLTSLDAHENKIKDVTVLIYLTNLSELDLSGNPLTGFTSIGRLENLTKLSLRDTDIIDGALDSLAGLKKLTQLDLEQNDKLTRNKVDELGEKLPGCRILSDDLLYAVTFGSLTFKSDAENISAISSGVLELDGLENFTNLKSLVLTDNAVIELEPLSALTQLQTLGLRGNQISSIEPLEGLKSLRSLDLTDNKIVSISALSNCTALEELHLGSNSIRDISALAYCRGLVSLELDGNEILDISALSGLVNLTMLNLDNNDISDLAPLYSLKNLQVLYIHENNIKLEDIEDLREALPNCIVACDDFSTQRGDGRTGFENGDDAAAVPVSGEGAY